MNQSKVRIQAQKGMMSTITHFGTGGIQHSKHIFRYRSQDDPEPIFQERGPNSVCPLPLVSFAPAQSAHSPAYTLLLRFSLMPSDPTAPEHLSTTHPTVTVSGPPLPHGPLLSWFCTHSKPSSFCPSACLESPQSQGHLPSCKT